MEEVINGALSIAGDFIWGVFSEVVGFFLAFYPDADPAIVGAIRSWGAVMPGGDLTFNVFYFVDMEVVTLFFGMTMVVLLAMLVFATVKAVVSLVHKVIEAVPVIE